MTSLLSIVDTHCHASPYWYEPVEALLNQMDANGVDLATLVQHHGQYDNEYLLSAVRDHPDRFVAIVMVDTSLPDAPTQLSRLADQGASGLRLRPTDRSPGGDALAIWRKAEELKLPVTTGSPIVTDLTTALFSELIEELSGLTIILEHLGWANQPVDEGTNFEQRRRVFSLSRFPNLYMKFHGLGEFCERNMPTSDPFPFEDRVTPVLDLAATAFGPERMMWGSDFPPVSRREGYRNALHWPRELLAKRFSPSEVGSMFGGVAKRVYGLS